MIIIYNNVPLIKESSLSSRRAAEFCWNNQSVEAFRRRFSFCLSQHTISFCWQHSKRGTFDSLPLTKCWFESLFREGAFDCINDKWESVSDLSLVYFVSLWWWRFLSDNQPLEMSGQIIPQDVPFDMRGLALMHMWWLSISVRSENEIWPRLSTFATAWITVIITDQIRQLTSTLVRQTCGRSANDNTHRKQFVQMWDAGFFFSFLSFHHFSETPRAV